MARRRKGEITETTERLQQLEEQFRGKPEAARIKVLRLLKEQPDLGIEDAAMLVDYSKQAVKRWLKVYREEGLDAVIGLSRGGKRFQKPGNELALLQQKLAAGEFSAIEDVFNWVAELTRPKLLQLAGDDEGTARSARLRTHSRHRTNGSRPDVHIPGPVHVPDHVLRFLVQLPATHDVEEWIEAVRTALKTLLSDVDHISIGLNTQCDLLNPQRYNPQGALFVIQHLSGKKAIGGEVNQEPGEKSHSDRLIDQLRRKGFPFEKYHPPKSFVYYYGGSAYLGVIALWRERERSPISDETILLVEQLREFMVFLLSDFVARHRHAKPVNFAFNEALEVLIREAGLTAQEMRIVILQMLGFTYDEMADTLNISTNTLRYHLKSVYSKTGAHSQAELFAKYFTPRFDPHKANE